MGHVIFPTLLWGAGLAALLLCVRSDVKDRIIPNEYAAIVAACGLALAATGWLRQLWISLAVAFALLVSLGFLCRMGLLGGGDAKLISAASLLFPPGETGRLLVAIACAGGVLSCVYLLARWKLRRRAFAHPAVVRNGRSPPAENESLFAQECARIVAGKPMPYGVAIAGGVAFHLIERLF